MKCARACLAPKRLSPQLSTRRHRSAERNAKTALIGGFLRVNTTNPCDSRRSLGNSETRTPMFARALHGDAAKSEAAMGLDFAADLLVPGLGRLFHRSGVHVLQDGQ